MNCKILLGILALVSIAGAETIEMGPYVVSFDLGDIEYETLDYTVKEGETYEGCEYTKYDQLILIDNGIFEVVLVDHSTSQSLSFHALCELMTWQPDTYFREVDNKNVVMLVGDGMDSIYGNTEFYIWYSLEGDNWIDPDGEFTADCWEDRDAYYVGKNRVILFSNADWDSTRQFLNTVHVCRKD